MELVIPMPGLGWGMGKISKTRSDLGWVGFRHLGPPIRLKLRQCLDQGFGEEKGNGKG